MSHETRTRHAPEVAGKLSTLDRYLPVWIGVAMAVGLLVGRFVPGIDTALDAITVDGISLPIALGLLIMMYPVLAKVRYDRLDTVTGDRRLLVGSLVLNWIVGPALMFTLAWLLLPDLPEYRTGLIIVGLARCIAMVIIWNDLACGDREAAAVLVAINSIFQVIMFAVLGWFYLSVLPGWLGLQQTTIDTSSIQIAKSVLIFLGIPLLAGYLSRRFGERAKGRQCTRIRSSRRSARGHCTACCSRSSYCSPCKANRSPRTRAMSRVSRTFGAHDGSPGLPITWWSLVAGDLRIPHFLGLHAMQVLLVTAWLLLMASHRRPWLRDDDVRARLVCIAGAGWAAAVAITLSQALRGQSIVHPDAATLVMATCVASVGVAAVAFSVRSARRSAPFACGEAPSDTHLSVR
ncbi:Bile acid:sodium symporter [Gordonia bronchialis DSM 43247]|uniref:Bile acid:sodium symporter n=1 Tax=Gordonia bronchialis (strain ATCC 25592 / DSM 43247 / BCRC 13721 / JCM 3198 / KCTC 3076 / NBRC 16047 / NCTC 10667) TaxID=526226 RepID=D0L825_GORB4|nr:Bile acid:sodium symporter [Gordonia bronchialis DSM 43247]STQ64822.1 Protein-tyrosine-phosphatase [Gordonia bronchialis]